MGLMYIFLIGLSASITLLLSPSNSCLSLFLLDFSRLPIDDGEAQACNLQIHASSSLIGTQQINFFKKDEHHNFDPPANTVA